MKKRQLAYEFDPNITSPAYLTRNRLLKGISVLAPMMRGRLLDFGCGSKPYRLLFDVDEYIGLDFENPGHPHANEQIDVFYDGKKIPFPDASFDAIFSSEVFEHVFNLPVVLTELNRVLKPGGQMLITCPFAICEHEVPNDFARYSSFGLKHILKEHGFDIVRQGKTGNSVEAVFQLWLMYIHQHVTPWFRKIPVLRSGFRFVTYTGLNLGAMFWSWLLPNRDDLYLNNVVLCKKMRMP